MLSYIIKDSTYIVISSIVCALLGSSRETIDISFIILKGIIVSTRKILKDQPKYFNINRRILYIYYKSILSI